MCPLLIPGLLVAGVVGLAATQGSNCAPACAPQSVCAAPAPCAPAGYGYAPAAAYNYTPAASYGYQAAPVQAYGAGYGNDGSRYVAGSNYSHQYR